MSTQAIQLIPDSSAMPPTAMTPMIRVLPLAGEAMRLVKLPGGVADLEHSEIRHDDGQCDPLSVREAELLRYLATNADRAISRDEILEQVWHLNPRRLITRTIDMHIANLRGKLHDDPGNPKILFTVRGKGYMFAAQPRS